MTGIIWYIDKEKGEERMHQLVDEYNSLGIQIERIKNTATSYQIHFQNEDYWQLAPALSSSKGLACNISLIQKGIPKEIMGKIILPCTKSKPYRAMGYYG